MEQFCDDSTKRIVQKNYFKACGVALSVIFPELYVLYIDYSKQELRKNNGTICPKEAIYNILKCVESVNKYTNDNDHCLDIGDVFNKWDRNSAKFQKLLIIVDGIEHLFEDDPKNFFFLGRDILEELHVRI